MTEVHVWTATGTDPRIDGKSVLLYFGFPANEFHAITTMAHFLGYVPLVVDRFPMSQPIFDIFEDVPGEELILAEELRVQMPGFTERKIKAGTRIKLVHHYELLIEEPWE